MDVLSHAVAGACTGALWGRPLLGAMVAAAPDAVLGVRRKRLPTRLYNATHGLPFIALCSAVAMLAGGVQTACLVALCLLSHIVLDLPTHGPQWAPPLLYPFNSIRYCFGTEWEFFNKSWRLGLALTLLWSFVCLALRFVTGFLSSPSAPSTTFLT
jgi:hypothetical protein